MIVIQSKGGYYYKLYNNGKKLRISREKYFSILKKLTRDKKTHIGGMLNSNMLNDIKDCRKLEKSNYKITTEITFQGRHGIVFEGLNTNTNMKKIIKQFTYADILSDQQKFNEFKYEIMTGMKARGCPNLLHTDGYYTDNEYCYIVMEYITGKNLEEYIKERNEKPIESEVIKFALQLATGLKFLHDNNIAHYDLKPENVMINVDDDIVKIIDFGGIHYANEQSKIYLKGSPAYLSPNYINKAFTYIELNKTIDIWSYGIILYLFIHGVGFWKKNLSHTNIVDIESLKTFIQSNNVVKKIERNCSSFPVIKKIMLLCCKQTSNERIPIDSIIELLNPTIEQSRNPINMFSSNEEDQF